MSKFRIEIAAAAWDDLFIPDETPPMLSDRQLEFILELLDSGYQVDAIVLNDDRCVPAFHANTIVRKEWAAKGYSIRNAFVYCEE